MKRCIVLALIFLPVVLLVSWTEPPPSDYWGHVITGRELPWHGRIAVDTLDIRPVPDPIFHDWLGKKILAVTVEYRQVFKAVLLSLTVVLLIALSQGSLVPVLVPIVFLLLYSFSPYLRPMTLTFPIFAALLLVMKRRQYFLAFLLLVLWGQIHLSWLIGMVIIAMDYYVDRYLVNSYAVNRRDLRFLLGLGIVVLIILGLHPAHFHVFRVFSDIPKLTILKEWQPPNVRSPLGLLFVLWSLVAIYELAVSTRDQINVRLLILYLFVTGLSFYAIRNAPYQMIVSVPLLAPLFPKAKLDWRKGLAVAGILWLGVYLVIPHRRRWSQGLQDIPRGVRVLAPPGIADYLAYWKGCKPLTDTRMLDPITLEDALKYYEMGDTTVLEKYRIQWVVTLEGEVLRFPIWTPDTSPATRRRQSTELLLQRGEGDPGRRPVGLR